MPRSWGWTSIWGCNRSKHSSLKGPKSARHLGLHQRMSFRGIQLFRPHDHNCIAAIYTCNSNSVSSCLVSSKEKSSDARGKTPCRGSANPISYLLSMGNLRYSKRNTLALSICSEAYGDQQKTIQSDYHVVCW